MAGLGCYLSEFLSPYPADNRADGAGLVVANGVYFYHCAAPRLDAVKKAVLTR